MKILHFVNTLKEALRTESEELKFNMSVKIHTIPETFVSAVILISLRLERSLLLLGTSELSR
jgi:hypothetical protein